MRRGDRASDRSRDGKYAFARGAEFRVRPGRDLGGHLVGWPGHSWCGRNDRENRVRGVHVRAAHVLGVDVHDVDVRGVDVRGVESRVVDAHGVDAHGVDARGVDARGVDARVVDARVVDARDVDAHGVGVHGVGVLGVHARVGGHDRGRGCGGRKACPWQLAAWLRRDAIERVVSDQRYQMWGVEGLQWRYDD